MTAKTLMVLGTSSSAGKSLLVTALCRSFARRGLRVAPFKAQNMSNNAAVCPGGGEIGRAQAIQARAAGIPLSPDLNPILIKPEADAHSQVIVMGRPYRRLPAFDYYQHKAELWAVVTAAIDRLRSAYDLVILEGAGSPVELNLKSGDIVNLAAAEYAQAPALLVGDIDRGGIFAQLLGTLFLLEPSERARIKGLIVNKFRGDIRLFQDGVQMIEARGGVPVLGVVPYLPDLGLPEEDAVALDAPVVSASPLASHTIDVAVIHLPLIANFDDFDPFAADPGVRLRYVTSADALGRPDAVILPGTKATLADLDWLRSRGLDRAIREHAALGGAVVGICGGYQILGTSIHDPLGVETASRAGGLLPGLDLLPVHTVFSHDKATHPARARVLESPGWLASAAGLELSGYEIHMGRTHTPNPWLTLERQTGGMPQPDGASAMDGRIWGCYLHGLFASTAFRRLWLASLGWRGAVETTPDDLDERRLTAALDRLTDAVEAALDLPQLEKIVWES